MFVLNVYTLGRSLFILSWRRFAIVMALVAFGAEYAIMLTFGISGAASEATAGGALYDALTLGCVLIVAFALVGRLWAGGAGTITKEIVMEAIIVGTAATTYELAFHPVGQQLSHFTGEAIVDLGNALVVSLLVGVVTAWVCSVDTRVAEISSKSPISKLPKGIVVGALFAALCGVGSPAMLQAVHATYDQASNRASAVLDKAGHQRMYSQRIGWLASRGDLRALDETLTVAESEWGELSRDAAEYARRNGLHGADRLGLPGLGELDSAFRNYTMTARDLVWASAANRGELYRRLQSAIDQFLPLMEASVGSIVARQLELDAARDSGALAFLLPTIAIILACLIIWPLLRLIGAQNAGLELALERARRESQRAADSEALYRLLAEHSHDVINRTNLASEILYVSPSVESLVGFKPEDLTGTKAYEIIHPDDWARVRREYAKLVHFGSAARREPISYRLVRKDGTFVWVEVSVSVVWDGDTPVEFVDVVRDITLRRSVEQELTGARDNAERFHAELDAYRRALDTHAIVAATDRKGRITFANSKFCEISGYGQEELIGQTHSMLNSGFHSREFFVDLWRTIGSGRTWHGEICNRSKNGALYWVDTTVFPKAGSDGRPEGYISLRYDITGRKLAETASARREKLSEVILRMQSEMFAGGVLELVFRRALEDLLGVVGGEAAFVCEFERDESGRPWANLVSKGNVIDERDYSFNDDKPFLWNLDRLPPIVQECAGAGILFGGLTATYFGACAFYGFPLVAGGETLGLLAFGGKFTSESQIPEEVVQFVSAVADVLLAQRETERRQHAEAAASRLARLDALTGLGNRRLLIEEFELRTDHPDAKFALLLIDLDRFKPINDMHGHLVGDHVLLAVADRLRHNVRGGSAIIRLGGDEFAILTEPVRYDENVKDLSSRILEKLTAPIHVNGLVLSVGASIGVARYPADATSAQDLMSKADAAMYRAKVRRGEAQFFDSSMDEGIRRRAELETELRAAIEAHQVIPYFQPVVSLETQEVVGHEVLARWPHAKRGFVSPAEFIPIAEEAGLVEAMFWSMLRAACRKHQEAGCDTLLSVNLSAIQVRDPMLAPRLLQTLTELSFPPSRLEIEITESAMLGDIDRVRPLFLSLKNLGIRIALDDFGTGYSSLIMLRDLPIDKLKIDRSFVSDLSPEGDLNSIIVDAVLGLANALGLVVTAEGVESGEIARLLAERGCHLAQGYHFGAASPEVVNRAPAMLIAG